MPFQVKCLTILNKRNEEKYSPFAGKKPKMGTLDKSKMDWNKFVSEEGIKEELETHNKGKDG